MKPKHIYWILFLLPLLSKAQQDTLSLKEVIISASRWQQDAKTVPNRVLGITSKENTFQNSQTSADMMQNTGQIFVQKSQTGGGSVVLRGFEASRVLLVVDGVRMNNAIYRLGHLQDVITIDNSMLEKTEVIFGPSSTMYGSDALGGVMHFFTKKPQLNKTGVNAYTRYSSANNEKTAHVDFNLGFKKIASLSSVTYSEFGNLRVGNHFDSKYGDWGKCLYTVYRRNGVDIIDTNSQPNIMKASSYKQYDILQKLLYQQNEWVSHELNFQLSNNIGNVPRYDRMLELSKGKPKYAENYYGPQTRYFLAYTLTLSKKNKLYDDAKLIISTQKTNQDRINRKLNSNNRTSNFEDANIYAGNLDLTKQIIEKWNLFYGAEYIFNKIESTASSTDLSTGKVNWNKDDKTITTRFADGGSYWSSLAAYAQMNREFNKVISATAGLRLSSVSLTSNYTDTTAFPETKVTSGSIAPTGNLGLNFNLKTGTKISILGSTGFRAPNVEDMTAFAAASGGTARVPNPDLKSEYAYNAELNVYQTIGKESRVEAGIYSTILTNVMIVKNTQYNGSDSVNINGIMYKAQSIQNANRGNIKGAYVTAKIGLYKGIRFEGSLTYTTGDYHTKTLADKDTVVPMDHIPPMFGKAGFCYENKKLRLDAFARFSSAKKLEDYSPSGEDNLTQAAYTVDGSGKYTVAAGTPSWITYNFRASYRIMKNLSADAGIENILDTHYRQFASGISAPGRNVYLTLRANF